MTWLLSLANLPYWILLGAGVLLFLVVIAAGGDDDTGIESEGLGLDGDGPDIDANWGVVPLLAWLGVGKVPLILLLATDFFLWGLVGWILNVIAAQFVGHMPTAFIGLGSLIFIASGIGSLWFGSLVTRPIGRLFATFGQDASSDRLVGCLGTVSSKTVPHLTSGQIGQVDVTDPYNNLVTVSAALPQWAKVIPHRSQQVLIIDHRPPVYLAIAKDTSDEDRWLANYQLIKDSRS
ncbi:MAG: YqiJ family protein [Spirulina sp. SIO3F2]|nr:YqiJ family protein [Spirulina sp. SIO3F2]